MEAASCKQNCVGIFQHQPLFSGVTLSHTFCSPAGTPGTIATKMWHAVSGTELHPCAKFQPNPFSCFGGHAYQTDRQRDRQTDRMADSQIHTQTANLIPAITIGKCSSASKNQWQYIYRLRSNQHWICTEENVNTVGTRTVRHQASVYLMSHSCNDGNFSYNTRAHFNRLP